MTEIDNLPTAVIQKRRHAHWWWLLPMACAMLSGWLALDTWRSRGILIEIKFSEGHGLKAGDVLRHHGIAVGTVSEVRLSEDGTGIIVHLLIAREARHLARANARFWIVRPQLDLAGASGLDTVIGAKYLRVLPGTGPGTDMDAVLYRFTGLESPPLLDLQEPGGLKIIILAKGRGALRSGAPVSYRQVKIGVITAVDLAPDASAVEAQIYIHPDYRPLIRANTRFFRASATRLHAGFTGLTFKIDSLRTLIEGGIALAIPPSIGAEVNDLQRFELHDEPDDDWLDWVPAISLGYTDYPRPPLLVALLNWREPKIFGKFAQVTRRGWLLPTAAGLLGPADLLHAPLDAVAGSSSLTVAGSAVILGAARMQTEDLALLPLAHGKTPWPSARIRYAKEPEDCLIIAGSALPVRLIPQAKLIADPVADSVAAPISIQRIWTLSKQLAWDQRWHGAVVLGARDGRLLGFLLICGQQAVIALLPTQQVV